MGGLLKGINRHFCTKYNSKKGRVVSFSSQMWGNDGIEIFRKTVHFYKTDSGIA